MLRPVFSVIWRVVWWASANRRDRIADAILGHICPAPYAGNWTIRACNRAGTCGCSNRRSPQLAKAIGE